MLGATDNEGTVDAASGTLVVSQDAITVHKRRMDYAALFGAEMYGLVGGSRLRTRAPNKDEYKNLADACEGQRLQPFRRACSGRH